MQDHDEETGGSGTETDPERPSSNPAQEPGSDEGQEGEGAGGSDTERDPERPSSNPAQEPGSD